MIRTAESSFPNDPRSAGEARRFAQRTLASWDVPDLGDPAVLLVSEVVTNAVLHAGTDIRLSCHQRRSGVRVEVFDWSPLLPSARHYHADATTGRGLALVGALARSWGIRSDEGGKTVWFELGPPHGDPTKSRRAVISPLRVRDTTLHVLLQRASPPLVRATVEHADALLRELALLALGGELDDVFPQGWQLPQFDVAPILDAAEAAEARGEARADLALALPRGAEVAASERLRLVDRGDALAREDRLLCAPALPEVAVCRHWIYTQITEQAAGFAPQAWELPERLAPARVAAVLPAQELERLERAATARVVADDANRIIFVNQAAGELLRWPPEALVGQRLTVLIPPELREAHLAGFSRLQVTGQPRILGSTVHVPAVRRDGSSVEVALTIEELAGRGGRKAFQGELRPAEATPADGSHGV